MPFDLVLSPNQGNINVEIGGQRFRHMGTLLSQMKIWSDTLPLKTYQAYLDEGANFLTELTEGQRAQHDEALAAYYDLARETNPEFEIYRQTKRFQSLWSSINQAAENRAKNLSKRDRARKEVCRNWGSRGESFMQLNDAIQWSNKAGKLARTIPDYDLAMAHLNRILYQKRSSTRADRHISLVPGGTDLVNAVELYEGGKDVRALSVEELNAFLPAFELGINANGMLEYGKGQTRIAEVEMIQESQTAQTGPSDNHRDSSKINMRIAQGNPAQESDHLSTTSTQPTVSPSQTAQTGPSTGRQEPRELDIAITQEPACTSSAAAAQTGRGIEHQEMREVDMSGTPGALAQEHDHTSNIITHPAVPGVQAAPFHDLQELREVNMSRTTGVFIQDASNATTEPAVPGIQATAQTDASGAPQQTEDDDLSETVDCLCVMNEYMDLNTMRFIDSLPIKWSLIWQKRSLELIVRYEKVLRDAHNANQTQGSRYLCEHHIRELARGVGLRLQGSSYEVFLTRLAYIAENVSSYREFERKILLDSKSGWWFRNKQPSEVVRYKNNLHPYRYKPLHTTETLVNTLTEKLRSNGEQILSDLLSWYGINQASLTSLDDGGYIDFPHIFDWIFTTSDDFSIANLALQEARMHDHHLSTTEKSQNSTTHVVSSHQYSLSQQVLETYPVFYLINLLLVPAEKRKIFLVAYPNPLIHTSGRKPSQFSFPGKPGRRSTELKRDPLRAIIPVSEEDDNSCDCLLMGTAGSSNMRHFFAEYETRRTPGNNYQLDPMVLNEMAKKGRFTLKPQPIAKGAIRFLSSSIANSPHGPCARTAIQPQLLAVSNYASEEATLSNGISALYLEECRQTCTPMTTSPFGDRYSQVLPSLAIREHLSEISPLSGAIGLQRSFDDHLVLQEIATLLSGDQDAVGTYLHYWHSTATSALRLRFAFLRASEQWAYEDKSWFKREEGSTTPPESDTELVPIEPTDSNNEGNDQEGDVIMETEEEEGSG